jgi:uncharacterized protein (TIGR04255 family)
VCDGRRPLDCEAACAFGIESAVRRNSLTSGGPSIEPRSAWLFERLALVNVPNRETRSLKETSTENQTCSLRVHRAPPTAGESQPPGAVRGNPSGLTTGSRRLPGPLRRPRGTRLCEPGHGYARGTAFARVRLCADQQMRVQTVSINPADPTPTTVEDTAWRLTSEDGRWVATIAADSYTLETTSYRTWKGDFRTRLEALVQTVESALKPAVATRVGLRYVDSLRLGPEPDGYKKMISETLLGPLLHPLFGPGVTSTQQQFSFALDESLRVTIRHGLFPDPARAEASTYLLDTDIYREDLMRLDSAALLRVIDVMHDDHLRVFRACLTDAALAHLRESVS